MSARNVELLIHANQEEPNQIFPIQLYFMPLALGFDAPCYRLH